MPRPKGSKNKVKATKVTADFAAQIAAKQEEKAAVEAEILKVAASIEELKTDVKSLNADLKAKKASVKKLDKFQGWYPYHQSFRPDPLKQELFYEEKIDFPRRCGSRDVCCRCSCDSCRLRTQYVPLCVHRCRAF